MSLQTFPNSPYRLHQPFEPAGDQPTAIAQLVEGVNDGLAFQTLLGVTGSGKTFTMANVIAQLGRPAIVMAPNKTLAAQLYSEFREFFPENAVEYFVSYYDYCQPEAYPSSHYVMPRATVLPALEAIKAELAERIAFCRVGKFFCPHGLRTHGIGFTKGIENYSTICVTPSVMH